MSSDNPNQTGLVITLTESIRSFLLSVSKDSRLSQELRELALALSSATDASYKHIRSLWIQSDVEARPGLISLFSGSNFVFAIPKPREKNSAGGIIGLVFGMLFETLLFIIRTSEPNLKSPSSTSRMKKNQ
ncbi:Non-lysosomal glucosylceramidase isoform 1 [Hibiscus syriacus]|uniref:Non-lysosomal glucosylceramidase isoform 1 n=1 Tax=Hibiscus syriacus TaxID=106335 RepID=A0A6A2ZIS1_HIBSY|nr:Non-lysosomal glucosylceramidase isoform 1 [Hibiscus syriacus]